MTKSTAIKFTLLTLFLITFKWAYCQEVQYKHLSVKNGLPSNTIYKAFQDSKGFIWFGSDAGVARYDGVNFENFTMDDGLSDNEVLDIKEDSKGRIWFLTFNGQLSYIYNEKIYNQETDDTIKNFKQNGFICSMFEDKEHNIWFGRSSKLVTKLTPKGELIDFEMPFTHKAHSMSPYFFEKDGLHCMSACGIFKVKKHGIYTVEKFNPKSVTEFVPYTLSNNKIFYPSPNGIYGIIDGRKKCIINDSSHVSFNKIVNLTVTKKDEIWITTNIGQTCLFRKRGQNYYYEGRYLDSLQVIHVFIDKEENLWFCTRSNGVFFTLRNNLISTSLKKQNGLHADEILSMHLDNYKNIWLGFADGRVQCYNDNKFVTYESNFFNRSNNRILEIKSDSVGNILLATDEGISIIKRKSLQYSKPKFVRLENNEDDGKPYYAKDINISSKNRIYYNSAVCKGFLLPSKEDYIAQVDKSTLTRLRLFTSYIDKDEKLWVSAVIGLLGIKNNVIENYALKNSWFKQRFTKIIELSDGNLILCSAGRGLAVFNKNKIINLITVKNKLGSNTINDVIIFNNNIFIATNRGVSCFKYKNGTLIFKFNYDTNEGLLSNKVNALLIKDNLLYAATSEGLSIIKIQNYILKQPHLLTSIKFFKVNGINQVLTKTINIDYKKSHLQVHFKTPVFTHPELLIYQYQLIGRNENWVNTSNDFVEFYGLPPGKYTFRVRAKYNNIVDQEPAEFTFIVTPPFWKTIWFYSLIIISLLVIIYITIRILTKRKLEKQLFLFENERNLALERTRIADEMHDDVGADLSNLLLKIRMDEIKQNSNDSIDLTGMRKATSNIIKKMDEIIWSLNAQKDTIEGLVNFLAKYHQDLLNSNKMTGKLNLPSHIPDLFIRAELRRDIFLTVKESVNNTLKHAKASELSLYISINESIIEICITDNGVGFNHNQKKSGNGLVNLQKRAAKNKGSFTLSSSENNGTKIILSFPIS